MKKLKIMLVGLCLGCLAFPSGAQENKPNPGKKSQGVMAPLAEKYRGNLMKKSKLEVNEMQKIKANFFKGIILDKQKAMQVAPTPNKNISPSTY